MSRKPIELSNSYPYHVCARSNNRDWFDVPLRLVFGIYANVLARTIEAYRIECHAFVLMANHYHALVSTPLANLSQAMRFFMTESSRAIARSSNRINRIYGSRYHWTIIRHEEHYAHAFLYVYRNPIKHEVVTDVSQYPWSTLQDWHQKFNTLIQMKKGDFDAYIPNRKSQLISWINQKVDSDYEESLRKALRRSTFRFPKNKNGKRPTYIDKLQPKI